MIKKTAQEIIKEKLKDVQWIQGRYNKDTQRFKDFQIRIDTLEDLLKQLQREKIL